nr:hypothetical protein [Thermoleophilaceae bacterium]
MRGVLRPEDALGRASPAAWPWRLFSSMSAENLGLAVGSIALLLATGRISRETGELLR